MKRTIITLIFAFFTISLEAQIENGVGSVVQIKGKEIVIKYINPLDPLKMNQVLHAFPPDNDPILLKVTYPMQTSAKCIVFSGNGSALKQGMIVYDGINTEERKVEDKPVAKHEYKVNPINGHKYFLTSKATWEEAEKEAVDDGGHLVTINDPKEEEWLRNTFGKNSLFWIGLVKKHWYSGFEWVSGENSKYRNWASGQPDDFKGKENVGEMNFGSWDSSAKIIIYAMSWNDADPEGKDYGIAEIDTGAKE